VNFIITYAITACNEHLELNKLLSFISKHKRACDEIIVQVDSDNVTQQVIDIIKDYNLKVNEFKLNNHFANFKNNLKKISKGDYIFQIDADEIPSIEIVSNLHKIIESNIDVDLFLVPRINTVEGLTQQHIQKWNWRLNEKKWINWPDYQYRIFKNYFNIKWKNKVHEYISGANKAIKLPESPRYAIVHAKNIVKQEKQNSLYDKLV
jgi:hypothetical protein